MMNQTMILDSKLNKVERKCQLEFGESTVKKQRNTG